jgi:hypothetical protein
MRSRPAAFEPPSNVRAATLLVVGMRRRSTPISASGSPVGVDVEGRGPVGEGVRLADGVWLVEGVRLVDGVGDGVAIGPEVEGGGDRLAVALVEGPGVDALGVVGGPFEDEDAAPLHAVSSNDRAAATATPAVADRVRAATRRTTHLLAPPR